MILSPGRGYVFIHIPKTGGTSLALALEARAMKDDLMLGDTPKAVKRRRRLAGATANGRLWKHSTMSDIEGLVPDDVLDGLFAFTLVRNPWDRAVSYYHWLRQQSFDHPVVGLAKQREFEPFILHPDVLNSFRASSAGSYMRRSSGRVHCAVFIRIEQFATDASPLFDHLGFSLTLPHENRSDRNESYQGYYTEQSKLAVAQACAVDIKRFEYKFEPTEL